MSDLFRQQTQLYNNALSPYVHLQRMRGRTQTIQKQGMA